MNAPYKYIGRKIRHAPGPVGDHLHVNAHQSVIDTRNCASLHRDTDHAPDMAACRCGYLLCSQTGPCAPKQEDVLPEGWSQHYADKYTFVHVAGHEVRESVNGDWLWWRAPIIGSPASGQPKPTRELAMAAALEAAKPNRLELYDRLDLASAVASLPPEARKEAINLLLTGDAAKSAEPELPEGWEKDGDTVWKHPASGARVITSADGWRADLWDGQRRHYVSTIARGFEEALRGWKPKEPELRPGWTTTDSRYTYDLHDANGKYLAAVQIYPGQQWKVHCPPFSIMESVHPTIEAAMIRVEQLAAEWGKR